MQRWTLQPHLLEFPEIFQLSFLHINYLLLILILITCLVLALSRGARISVLVRLLKRSVAHTNLLNLKEREDIIVYIYSLESE
jgi:hypothetical protein